MSDQRKVWRYGVPPHAGDNAYPRRRHWRQQMSVGLRRATPCSTQPRVGLTLTSQRGLIQGLLRRIETGAMPLSSPRANVIHAGIRIRHAAAGRLYGAGCPCQSVTSTPCQNAT